MVDQLINTEYIQRSKIFIYPFLYIPYDCLVSPENTYISWIKDGKEIISQYDKKLICVYQDITGEKERVDEKNHLLHNRYFEDIQPLGNGKTAYVFCIKRINIDWEWKVFIEGNYSLLTDVAKKTIRNFYKEDPMKTYIDVYFNPEDYYDQYSQILDIPIDVLLRNGELLSRPDINKETLIT